MKPAEPVRMLDGLRSQSPLDENGDMLLRSFFTKSFRGLDKSPDQLYSEFLDLTRSGDFESTQLKEWLDITAVGPAWNRLLDESRSATCAGILAPMLHGRVVDLLSGTGTLTRALANAGIDISAFERKEAYTADLLAYDTGDYTDLAVSPPKGHFDVGLLCTVLHHEPEPAELLDLCQSMGLEYVVIVENCVSESVTQDFHDFMDDFYNIALNDFGVPCPGQHRTEGEWLEYLGQYGDARLCSKINEVPGMPFPYEVFEVDFR